MGGRKLAFQSLLFKNEASRVKLNSEAPEFFVDLNLDQIVNAITSGSDYDLKPFFYTPLRDIEEMLYRQDIMRDLENGALLENLKSFSDRVRSILHSIESYNKIGYKNFEEGIFLDTVNDYYDSVNRFMSDLDEANLQSAGLSSFREYLSTYTGSEQFISLSSQAKKLRAELSEIKYCMTVKSDCIKVRKYESEKDYSVDVLNTFEKFNLGAVKDYCVKLGNTYEINHVMSGILDLLARLYPDIFSELDDYYTNNKNFLDETINTFYREIQFYIAYLDYIGFLKNNGLKFCYPLITQTKEVYNCEGFDLALAFKLAWKQSQIVCNDFYLNGKERVIVVSGPNQGGKTTFARMFGQLHYLASLGCPVPGKEAQLFLYDNIFTHFEREEDISNLRGKLQDDLVRIHNVLSEATSNSIIIMNEIFNSTTLNDAVFLSSKIMNSIIKHDLLCVFVTFIVEVSSLSDKTVSMVSTVVPENPAVRTYKIIRKPADGLAYALSIAEKYRLTYDSIRERIQ
jgi:DNA mismatch repair protein MutS